MHPHSRIASSPNGRPRSWKSWSRIAPPRARPCTRSCATSSAERRQGFAPRRLISAADLTTDRWSVIIVSSASKRGEHPMHPAPSTRLTSLAAHRPFLYYVSARGFSEFSYQIGTVAMGWQVYALTHSAFDLGMVGLVQFIPSALMVIAAGHVADRYDRQRVAQICQFVQALTAAFLAWGTFAGWLSLAQIFAAMALFGVATAFENPAAAALLPGVAPEGMLQKGTAVYSATWQIATISGPALGGLAYAAAPSVPYAVMAAFWLMSGAFNGAIKVNRIV